MMFEFVKYLIYLVGLSIEKTHNNIVKPLYVCVYLILNINVSVTFHFQNDQYILIVYFIDNLHFQ